MKVLLVLLAVGVLFWLLRGSLRRRMPPPGAKPGAAPDSPQPMLRVFCGAAHREAFETAHPDS
jgi:hypothetical protein